MINPGDIFTVHDYGNGGRLGNQMFSISALLGLAEKHGCRYALPQWKYAEYFPNFPKPEPLAATHIYHEPAFHYTGFVEEELIEIVPTENRVIDLRGYFQSEKYWEGCKEKVLRMFEFSDEVKKRNKRKLFYRPSVALHMRFGDYKNNPYYAGLIKEEYYERAISELSDIWNGCEHYCMFSDEPEEAKKILGRLNISINDYTVMFDGNEMDHLFLMSQCDAIICANSSFSWFGAALGKQDKTVIQPASWFSGEGLKNDTKDLYLQNAIKL